jgi:hypothetical protein
VQTRHQRVRHQCVGIAAACRPQPIGDVGRGLIFAERFERELRDPAGEQSGHARRLDHSIDRRFAEQQNLQHPASFHFERSEQPQFFEHRRVHLLRILDDQQADPAHRRLVIQKALQQAPAIALVVVFQREAELAQHLQQEIARRQMLARHGRNDESLIEPLQETADQRRLAAAARRRQHTEPRSRPEDLRHEFESANVLFAGEEALAIVDERIGGQSEAREEDVVSGRGLRHGQKLMT